MTYETSNADTGRRWWQWLQKWLPFVADPGIYAFIDWQYTGTVVCREEEGP